VEDNTTFQAAIRHAIGLHYPCLADAPTSAFIVARKLLSPGFHKQRSALAQRSSASEKPYRKRSQFTKQRTRLTRVRTRILRQALLFFFEQFQEKLAENPEYYGVCIIEGICRINPGQRLGWLAQQRAIARENKFRGHNGRPR
jgi:hypothetical protein